MPMSVCVRYPELMFRAIALALLAISVTTAQQPGAEAARKAAESWVVLIDSGKYAESWDEASTSFKQAITKDKWEEAVKQARAPLGKFKSRVFSLSQFVKDPPNSPPGDYYILQFTSDFENRNGATETIVVVHQNEKEWRVAGYFIK
jgi:hypothetical protein